MSNINTLFSEGNSTGDFIINRYHIMKCFREITVGRHWPRKQWLQSISRKFVTVWLGKSTYSTKKDPWTSSSLRDKYVCFQIVLAFQWAHRDGFRAQGQLLTPSELGDRSPQRRRRWSNSGSRVPDPVVRTKGILLCEQSVPTLSGPISELRWS